MRTIFATAALAIAVSTSLATAADEYKVRLSHPSKVGDKVDVATNVEFKMTQKIELPDKTVKQDKKEYKAVLEGIETVEAVNEHGDATKASVKITKCTKDDADLIPAGSVLVAENVDGKTQYKIDGTDPDDDAKTVLTELIDMAKPDEPTTDAMFGTDKPVKIGDTWSINSEAFAKAISDEDVHIKAEQVKGEGKLVDVSTVDGVQVESIKVTLQLDAPDKDPDSKSGIHDLTSKIEETGTTPVDENRSDSTSKWVRQTSFMVDADGGVVVTISTHETREDKSTEAKK